VDGATSQAILLPNDFEIHLAIPNGDSWAYLDMSLGMLRPAGTYPCGGVAGTADWVSLGYKESETSYLWSSDCSIELTEIGDVGAPVKGTASAIVIAKAPATSEPLAVTATFGAERTSARVARPGPDPGCARRRRADAVAPSSRSERRAQPFGPLAFGVWMPRPRSWPPFVITKARFP
jgi:hypothetical protein